MKDAVSAQKSPSRVRDGDGDEGVAGRNGREKYILKERSMIFHKKETEVIKLGARPGPLVVQL